ncbi:MAG TPA: tetratricopeptide repeat protein [Planctomycetota bacterium]|nr:tetratricopeptide repeat protein [Planctomycetota bacterium]
MKLVTQLVLTVLVSALTTAGAVSMLRPAEQGGPAGAPVASLQSSLDSLQSEQRELRASLDNLALRMGTTASAPSRQPLEELEATVARVLEEREAARAGTAPAADAPAAGAALDLDDTVAALLDPALDRAAREALWQKVRDAGMLDAVIAAYEQRAKDRPNDAAAQADLGHAYLQKIYEVGSGPLASVWADKADNAFDAALALDDHNWDARFTNAVSLTFWPPIFGKQPEAITNFQTLLEQQAGQAKNPAFAQTYLMLGNLYAQQGKSGEAAAMWKQGLAEYPDDPSLLGKLGQS